MSTMTRTDIHRPSAPEFDPESYDFFGCFDLSPEWGDPSRVQTVSRLVDQGWSFSGAPHGSGQCSHCGARIRYAALMGHTASKTLLYIGETCLDNRFSLTKGEFAALRKAAALNAERQNKQATIAQFLADHPDMVWLSYAQNIGSAGATLRYTSYYAEEEYDTQEEAEQHFGSEWYVTHKGGTAWSDRTRMYEKIDTLSDMWYRVQKWGSLSDKAVAYAEKIIGWMSEAEVRLQQREAAERVLTESGVQVPVGRVVIEGEVVSTKWYANDFGGTLKMLVKNEAGWKVFGSVPSSIEVEKGTKVKFTATVTATEDDLFGKFSRPAKAEVLA